MSCNLIPAAHRAMTEAAGITGLNNTDTINRALQVYALLMRATADGQKILLRSADDTLHQVIIV